MNNLLACFKLSKRKRKTPGVDCTEALLRVHQLCCSSRTFWFGGTSLNRFVVRSVREPFRHTASRTSSQSFMSVDSSLKTTHGDKHSAVNLPSHTSVRTESRGVVGRLPNHKRLSVNMSFLHLYFTDLIPLYLRRNASEATVVYASMLNFPPVYNRCFQQ